jgi:hypothetical protein
VRTSVESPGCDHAPVTPDRLGLVIGAVFGLVYVVVNAGVLPSPAGPLLQVLGVAAFIGVLAALRRGTRTRAAGSGAERGFGPGYRRVVAAEVAAAVVGIVLLNGPLDLSQGVLPWVSFVVGVHFLALARVWEEPSLGWLGPGALLLTGSLWGAARRDP